jgi:hypothetical protein
MKKGFTAFGQKINDYPLKPITKIPLKSKDPFDLKIPYQKEKPDQRQPGVLDIIHEIKKKPTVIKIMGNIKRRFK